MDESATVAGNRRKREPPRRARLLAHPTTRTTAWLYLAYGSRVVVPLATIPYLTRVLGADGWGRVAVAYAIALWLQLLIEFSFVFSATRDVARARDNPTQLSNIVASVHGAKCLLTIASVLPLIFVYLGLGLFHKSPEFLLWAWLIAIGQGFNPMFYFQGIERAAAPAILEASTRCLGMALIFALVRSPDQAADALAFPATAALFSSLLSNWWLYSRHVSARLPTWRQIGRRLSAGVNLFGFRATCGLYTIMSPVLLSLFVAPAAVAFYAASEKICRSLQQSVFPLIQGVYPQINLLAKNSSPRQLRLVQSIILSTMIGLTVALAVILSIVASKVGLLLGAEFEPAVPMIRTLAWIIPIVTFREILAIHWLLPAGRDRMVLLSAIVGASIYFCSALAMAPRTGATGMIASVLASELAAGLFLAAAVVHGRRSQASREPEDNTVTEDLNTFEEVVGPDSPM